MTYLVELPIDSFFLSFLIMFLVLHNIEGT